MAHEELKALYEIDKQHSYTPWEFWEIYAHALGRWSGVVGVPLWAAGAKYRRKPDAPVWPDDKEDARKWRELEDRVKFGNSKPDANFVLDCYLEVACPEPQLVQGYTAEQWQTIIDGKFLCEFSDDGGFPDNNKIINRLSKVRKEGVRAFVCQGEISWHYCRPLRITGVRQPWFGGECPITGDVVIKVRDGQVRLTSALMSIWQHSGASNDIVEFIEL